MRPGLTYADGAPLTAERFRYAVERACDPATESPYAPILFDVVGCEALFTGRAAAATPGATPVMSDADLAAARAGLGVRAVDDRTLEIRLVKPAAYFPTVASTWVLFPVQQEVVERDPTGWWRDPANRIGNGPFRLTRIEADGALPRIGFAANGRYWGGRPKLDGIEYLYYADENAALEAYRRGELDITTPPLGMRPKAEDDPVLSKELVRYPIGATIQLDLNLTREPFTDKAVREAFAYAVDREALCREIAEGTCEPALSWAPPGVPGHIETDAYAFDPERARQALAASSYGGPAGLPEIVWAYSNTDQFLGRATEWLAEQYRTALGVEVTLAPTDDEALNELFYAGPAARPEILWTGWFQDYPDPQNWLSIYWTCGSPVSAGLVGYCNPAFDQLVRAADAEPDPARRQAQYEEAGRLLVADAPSVFLFHPTALALVTPRLIGYATNPTDQWPGWTTPLTLDLAPAGATPAASPMASPAASARESSGWAALFGRGAAA